MENELKIDINLAKFSGTRTPIRLDVNSGFPKKTLLYFSVVFFIYFSTFYLAYLLKEKSFVLDSESINFAGLLLLSTFIGRIFSGKYRIIGQNNIKWSIKPLFNSFILSFIILILFLELFKIPLGIRNYALIGMFLGLLVEAYYYMLLKIYQKSGISFLEHKKLSIKYLLLDWFILSSFMYLGISKSDFTISFLDHELILISVTYISWMISAATTHKFIPSIVSNSRWNAIELQIKFYFRILILIILAVIFLDISFEISSLYVKAFIGYSILSSLVSMFLFAEKIKNKTDESTVVFLKAYEIKDQQSPSKYVNGSTKYAYKGNGRAESVASQEFKFEYLKEYSEVFAVLHSMLDLSSFDTRKSLIIKSDQPNDIANRKSDFYQLLVNLHVLNDQKHLNTYILDVKNALVKGGVFVGALLPHHYRYKRFLKKSSFWFGNIIYFMDFIWKRVLPKLPVSREIYSTFSRERDRALSLAEGLGRLAYCGFKIIDLAAVDDVVYFAAVKNGGFQPAKKFFYSPIFKMKRIGKDGKPIYVYKLRTMYPYSEFIQDFVYNHNKLESGGKFKDDFRVPAWGRLFRKLWIDELPMLINWAKRDLKLVGVRPISNHYLSLYSKEHQDRRSKFKPGLFPPFYADMPDTIEEIELSEKRYLDAYEKDPIKTDAIYFFKAAKNIILNKKRSA